MSKKKKIGLFNCIFIIFLLFFVVEAVKQEIKIYEINHEINETNNRLVELNQKHEELKAEEKLIDDPSYIEKIAREQYNMVKKMEVPVHVKE